MAYNKNTLARLIEEKYRNRWNSAHPKAPMESSGDGYDDRMLLFTSIAEGLLDHLHNEAPGAIIVDKGEHSHGTSPSTSAHTHNVKVNIS